MTEVLAVTGADEPFGRRVVRTLLDPAGAGAVDPASLVLIVWALDGPSPAVAADSEISDWIDRGAQLRFASFDDPASVATAFDGVTRVLLLSVHADDETRLRRHLSAVAGAEKAGVQFLAYTSVTRADATTLAPAAVHARTEDAIRATGIDYCLLRNGFYTENELRWIQRAADGEALVTAAGDGRVSWASRDDYADAAAAVLRASSSSSAPSSAVYELGGLAISYAELAEIVGEVAGRPVALVSLTEAEYGAYLEQFGLGPAVAARVAGLQTSIAAGDLEVGPADLRQLLGREPEPVAATIRRLLTPR